MEIIGIGLFLFIMFVITWTVIASNAPSIPPQVSPDFDALRWKPFSEAVLEDKVKNLKRENEYMAAEIEHIKRSCKLHHQPPFLGCGGCHHSTRYFAQTVEGQRMADMLANAKNTTAQLLKDLTA